MLSVQSEKNSSFIFLWGHKYLNLDSSFKVLLDITFLENSRKVTFELTVCPGSSDPTYSIESSYFIQLSSCDLKSFCTVNK